MIPPTARQHDLLTFIAAQPVCPSIRQMAEAIGSYKGAVHKMLGRLEQRGWIARDAGGALRILKHVPTPLRFIAVAAPPASGGEGPTPFWNYPDHGARRCSEWMQAEAA